MFNHDRSVIRCKKWDDFCLTCKVESDEEADEWCECCPHNPLKIPDDWDE